MELRQLQHFLAVAEEGQFTRAARRVNIVQSALSTSIRTLEDELDAQLFVRTTRQVRLTAAGHALLVNARNILDSVRHAREAVAEAQGLKRGTISIGTVQSLPAFVDLPSLIEKFHADHPGIEIRLCQDSATQLLERIRSGTLDLAFLPLCEPPMGIETTMIACEALVLACAPTHPLAGRSAVSLAALGNEPFVDFEPQWGTRKLVDQGFRSAGIERHIAFEVSELGTMIELVRRGLGVALLPEAIVRSEISLALAELAEPELCWELVVAYAKGSAQAQPAGQAARAFMALLPNAAEFRMQG